MQKLKEKYKELLDLSRNTLKSYFLGEKLEVSQEIIKKYSQKKACFVTLTINGNLRGCIGNLKAYQELWREVIENSLNAAFRDPRFLPVSYSELNKIKIEISILSIPRRINYRNEKDLLLKIDRKMGIILKKGFNSATFLPQVWKEIPIKKNFLEQLSLKAGLNKNEWKDAEIEFYRVESIKEE